MTSETTPAGAERASLPLKPVLGWSSFSRSEESLRLPSIDDIKNTVITTSGRAAIYQALLQLRLNYYSQGHVHPLPATRR